MRLRARVRVRGCGCRALCVRAHVPGMGVQEAGTAAAVRLPALLCRASLPHNRTPHPPHPPPRPAPLHFPSTHRDAKLSVLEWDVRHHTLRTTSMHFFQGGQPPPPPPPGPPGSQPPPPPPHSMHQQHQGPQHQGQGQGQQQREARTAVPLPPRVVADPAGRCAAVVMYFCQLALVPAIEVGRGSGGFWRVGVACGVWVWGGVGAWVG